MLNNKLFKIFLIFQTFIFLYLINVSNSKKCFYESYEFFKWMRKIQIQIANTLITNIAPMKYFNFYNTTYNDYVLMKGNIVIFDDDINEYVALFKEFLLPVYYNDFIYHF